jgi:hypothetical protein
MKTKTHKTNYILLNDDIFSSIKKRINAGNNGATIFVPHVCNNVDVFGAGFAAQVGENYPEVKANYHLLGKNFLRNNLGHSQIVKVYEDKKYRHKLFFVNMIAQNGIKNPKNHRPLHYGALVKSMTLLSQYIHNNTGYSQKTEKIEIHCPKFGSGLSGGNWSFISDLIEDLWRPYNVFVYNFQSPRYKN